MYKWKKKTFLVLRLLITESACRPFALLAALRTFCRSVLSRPNQWRLTCCFFATVQFSFLYDLKVYCRVLFRLRKMLLLSRRICNTLREGRLPWKPILIKDVSGVKRKVIARWVKFRKLWYNIQMECLWPNTAHFYPSMQFCQRVGKSPWHLLHMFSLINASIVPTTFQYFHVSVCSAQYPNDSNGLRFNVALSFPCVPREGMRARNCLNALVCTRLWDSLCSFTTMPAMYVCECLFWWDSLQILFIVYTDM